MALDVPINASCKTSLAYTIKMTKPLILASGSPRRKELLSQLGYTFSVVKTDVEECRQSGENAFDYVSRLAKDKAMAVVELEPNSVVIGSDTIVVCDQPVLEKPDYLATAKQKLIARSGRPRQFMKEVRIPTNR